MGAKLLFNFVRGCRTVWPRIVIRFVPTREAWSAIVILFEKDTGGLGGGGSVDVRLKVDIIDEWTGSGVAECIVLSCT